MRKTATCSHDRHWDGPINTTVISDAIFTDTKRVMWFCFSTKPSWGNWIYCSCLLTALPVLIDGIARACWRLCGKTETRSTFGQHICHWRSTSIYQRTHHNETSHPYTQSICLNFGLRNSSPVSSDLLSFRIFVLFAFWTSSKTNSVAHFSCLIISLPCPLHQSPPHNLLHIQFRNLRRNLALL